MSKWSIIIDLAYKIASIVIWIIILLVLLYGISDHQAMVEEKAKFRKIEREIKDCALMSNCKIMGHGFLKTSIPKNKTP